MAFLLLTLSIPLPYFHLYARCILCLLFSYYIRLSVDALAEAFCGAVGSSARVFDMVGLPCICHHMSHVCYKLRKHSRGVLGTCPGLCWQNRKVCL